MRYLLYFPVTIGCGGVGTLPTHYKIGKLSYNDSGTYREIQLIPQNELNHYVNSSYLNPTTKNPVYIRTSATAIQVYPTSITSGVTCNIIEKPATPSWGYVVINGKALYNQNTTTDFDLHEAEENNLVMRILELSGITLKDPALTDTALRDQQTDKAEKNN